MRYREIEVRIYQDLSAEDIQQIEFHDDPMGASFFLDHYHVVPIIQAASGVSDEQPVILDANNTVQVWMMTVYLEAFGIPFVELNDPSKFVWEEAHVIVSFPERSQSELRSVFPEARCELTNEEISIYRAMHCRLTPAQYPTFPLNNNRSDINH
jgi:hypothetical protein